MHQENIERNLTQNYLTTKDCLTTKLKVNRNKATYGKFPLLLSIETTKTKSVFETSLATCTIDEKKIAFKKSKYHCTWMLLKSIQLSKYYSYNS